MMSPFPPPPATVTHYQVDGVDVIGIHGRVDQLLVPQLDRTINRLFQDGRYQLLIEITHITYINSGGLRSLMAAWRTARRAQGEILLFGDSPRVLHTLQMIGFDQLFKIFPDLDTARHTLLAP